jgi:endonuclease/exonuclease/phosphatase (EEP) superfamily protein YafD
MMGDFNATMDHHALREVVRAGWSPVGSAVGKGLAATWPAGSSRLPGIAIDHILVGPDGGPSSLEIRRVSGTDHKALIAELFIPLR